MGRGYVVDPPPHLPISLPPHTSPDSRFPIPDSLLPIPDSQFPIPDSRLQPISH
ncbi:MAG: hypothetical protein F6J98_16535 [Moorea sp. SIO4G2]|nr:hypothetical protein [Moorena sp. SIO4G2]